MNFNERLQGIITDGDITQTELAKIIGTNRKQISRWINNEQEMGIQKLKTICEYYGVSADYLLGLPKGLQWPR